MTEDIRTAIRDKALAIGFDAIGFAPADAGERARSALARFVEQGYHGDMGWMAESADRRADPRALWPETRSVIVLAQSYAPPGDPRHGLSGRGEISVYAANKDYHDLVKNRLKQLARWLHEDRGAAVKVFVDTAPVLEKALAQQAGLGWTGRHTNLVSREHGSWLFLGEVFTDLEIPPDIPSE